MGCGSSTAKRRADGRWQEAKPNRLTAVEEEVEAMNEAECRMSIIALVEGTHDDRFSMALKELSSLSEILEVSETGFEASQELDGGGEGGPAPEAQVAKPSAAKEARAAKWAGPQTGPQNNPHTVTRTSVIDRADDMKDEEKDDALCAILDRVEHPTSGAIVDRLSSIAARVSVAVRGSAGEDAADAVDSEAEDDDDGVDPALRELQEWVQTLDAMQQAHIEKLYVLGVLSETDSIARHERYVKACRRAMGKQSTKHQASARRLKQLAAPGLHSTVREKARLESESSNASIKSARADDPSQGASHMAEGDIGKMWQEHEQSFVEQSSTNK